MLFNFRVNQTFPIVHRVMLLVQQLKSIVQLLLGLLLNVIEHEKDQYF